MNPPLRIRLLAPGDLAFADSLRALAGWNQTPADWRRFLALEPEGCFLAEWAGAPVATATTLRYGPDVAWIGMLLVHPECRRRGVGRALLERCVAWLRERGVRCLKLDATPAGQRVYDPMGFRSEWTLSRWEHCGAAVPAPAGARLRAWQAPDGGRIAPLDAAAFGAPRRRLVAALAEQSRDAFVCETQAGEIAGYGFLRLGARAAYLGPVAASSAAAGLELVQALLARNPGQRVFWDIPDANAPAVNWARRHGFAPQRTLTRMYLGENLAPGDPRQQFALAGPEVG